MDSLKSILNCKICNKLFKGVPLVVSCCGATICSDHIQYKTIELLNKSQTIRVFECQLCKCSHNMKNKRFSINKVVEQMLEIDFDKLSLGEIYEKANEEYNNLQSSFEKINNLINDPRNFIYEHVYELKRKIDLRREKLKIKIDSICNEMIEKLDIFQKECYENSEILRLKEKNAQLINEVQTNLDKWNVDNKNFLLMIDDSKRKKIQLKAKELDIKLDTRLKELEQELLMYKVWTFKENKDVITKFKKELIQFEGYLFI
jgi:hypothetical protein